MSRLAVVFREAGVMSATTIGAGMFALPYVFTKSGWLVGLFYLSALVILIVFIHLIYWRVLVATDGRKRLLGLVKEHGGIFGYYVGFISIVIGLLLALVIYLILGAQFIKILWPQAGYFLSLLLFWAVSVLPLLFKERRIITLEILGIFFMAAIILLVFLTSDVGRWLSYVPIAETKNLLLPFGVVLFSLAGWTAIEPLYSTRKDSGQSISLPVVSFTLGTLLTAFLYLFFVVGILGSASTIMPDAVSGLSNWSPWKLGILSALGLFAIWTSYMPIGLEVKNSLIDDLGWKPTRSLFVVIFAPILLVFSGFNNFLSVLGLAGGVFLSMQYLFMAWVGLKVLSLSRVKRVLLGLVSVTFFLGTIYEIYYFVVGPHT
ncbi:MAG: hypothetical protein AAB655_00355 [Patescibacteria group bacterium]